MLHALLRTRPWMAAFTALALHMLFSATPAAAAGTRLIMVEQDGCRYCVDWVREIGPGYPKSAEGRFAPLKRVKRGDKALKGFNPVVYTPTFIVERNGEEVGRVTGYAGKMFFYEELDEQLRKAGFTPQWGIPSLDKTSLPGPRLTTGSFLNAAD
jgi:hypothetical protein